MTIKLVPNTNDYKKTLKRFKGYYCPVKIESKAYGSQYQRKKG